MSKRISAFTDDALGNSDATALAEAIRNREIHPNEVLEAAISRAEKVNPSLNAIVLSMYDDARKTPPHKSGAFAGVPTFIKDTDPIAGYPTQLGTGVFKAKPAKKNSRFVNQFLSSGLITLGKTTLPEFGLICSTENERWAVTRNPWNTDYTTGGSSSGSAALVASGVVPIATANDGAGSIRIPASICGLVGLKPTRGRIHGLDGSELLPIQIIHQGVLTRTVRDTALFFGEAEKFYRNTRLPALGTIQHPGKKRLRIGWLNSRPSGTLGHQDEDTQRVQRETAQLLENLGHRVEPIEFPIEADSMVGLFLDYYGFLAYMTTRFSRFTLQARVNRHDLEPFTEGLSSQFRRNMLHFPATVRRMKQLGRQALPLLESYDVIMSPVIAHKTPEIGYFSPTISYEEVSRRAVHFALYCGMYNVTGNPAISLPLGTDHNGMPMGVQFAAAFGMDGLLLELAYELEEAKPFRGIDQAV
jgi:amidase